MTDFILDNEPVIRVAFFVGVFFGMALWELRAPRRVLTQSKIVRWVNNIGLVTLDTLVVRVLFPAATVGVAAFAQEQGWGLFSYLQWPVLLEIVIAVIVLDVAIYLQHVLFHAVPMLWRMHRMHHTDLDIDVTTGSRFHPIEIVLSLLLKFGVVIALGAHPASVLIFEVLLNGMAMFNHSNVKMPENIDRVLRWLIVTPDMHRVHHSVIDYETNSNYGFNLSIWDRIFGTYTSQPEKGHEGMTIGINRFQDKKFLTLGWMLYQPFIGKVDDYVINRRRWSKDQTD